MTNKTVILDLDGFLFEEKPTFERCLAKPLKDAKYLTHKLFSLEYNVIIWTARGWAEYEMTKKQLDDYNIYYSELIMGKPIAIVFGDDRSVKTIQELKDKLEIN